MSETGCSYCKRCGDVYKPGDPDMCQLCIEGATKYEERKKLPSECPCAQEHYGIRCDRCLLNICPKNAIIQRLGWGLADGTAIYCNNGLCPPLNLRDTCGIQIRMKSV